MPLTTVSRRDNPDRSLARSAWESASPKEPSRRVRYDQEQLIPKYFSSKFCACFFKEGLTLLLKGSKFPTPIIELVRTPARITPYPTGRLFRGGVFPGTSCQATIAPSPLGHFATCFS
jgi:hypothetical protein